MQDQLLERASLLFEQKRYDEAHKALLEVLSYEPENVRVLLMLAEIKIQKEDLEDALQMVNNAIALEPENDVPFYYKARILILQEKLDEAIGNLDTAVSIDPYDADNYAMLGYVHNQKRNYAKGLAFANAALEVDASHVFALNVRSSAQLKLNLKDDSFATIENALHEDPNNAYTHANYGWGLFEKRQHDKALEHFAQSLRNDPNSEYAQSGMAEALKAKYLVYRWFLQYSFWMSNMASKNQWIFIVGFYFGSRALRTVADKNPALQPYLYPIIILLAIFAFSTWVMAPLSNLLFSLNRYGKHLLSKDEKNSAIFTGMSLLVFAIGMVFYVVTKQELGLALAVFGFTMMIPMSRFFEKPARLFKAYALAMLGVGVVSLVVLVQTGNLFSFFSIVYLLGFMAFQWIANYFSIKR